MDAAAWRAATDKAAADLGITLAELSRRLGYASPKALDTSRRSGAPAYMVMALRGVLAGH